MRLHPANANYRALYQNNISAVRVPYRRYQAYRTPTSRPQISPTPTPERRNSAPKPPHQVSSVPCQRHASHPGLSGRCPTPYLFCVSANDCAVERDRPERFLRHPLELSAHPCYYSSTALAVEPLQSITDPVGTSADLSHFCCKSRDLFLSSSLREPESGTYRQASQLRSGTKWNGMERFSRNAAIVSTRSGPSSALPPRLASSHTIPATSWASAGSGVASTSWASL